MNTVEHIVDIAMSGFWAFIGCVILIGIPARLIAVIVTSFFMHIAVIIKGWPAQTPKRTEDEK
jgi:hypothetical protein